MKQRGVFMRCICLLCVIGLLPAVSGCGVTAEESRAVVESFLAAEETILAMGSFVSEDGTTKSMSEDMLRQTIDEYNDRVDACFSAASAFSDYKAENENRLRTVFTEPKTYRVDGGVISDRVESVKKGNTADTNELRIRLVTFQNWVDYTEGAGYRITCGANEVLIAATMIMEEGSWKLFEINEDTVISEWTPDESTAALSRSYSSFDEAKKAAEAIDVPALCPLSVDAA